MFFLLNRPMKALQGIKAISFDADGTLWDFDKVMRHSLHHVLTELENSDTQVADMLDIDKMIEIRNKVVEELRGKVTNLEQVRLEAFRQTLRYVGRPDDSLAAHLNQVYLRHRFEDIELFNDVLPTLNALRYRYTLGILSNGNSYPERCGLEDIFEFTVFSQDYGVEKPGPRIFQIALGKAGCSRGELFHVGDSLETDVRGAINSGIPCAWLNRKRLRNDSDIRTEYEISSLLELLEIFLLNT